MIYWLFLKIKVNYNEKQLIINKYDNYNIKTYWLWLITLKYLIIITKYVYNFG